jgi:energy-coupling factor transporter ATP-binding protein EcfA2
MSKPKFLRGSEWRRWDLQVHTPFSALNNGFGNDFASYAAKVLTLAVERKIAAIGVTDYFCIEGYKKFRQLVRDQQQLEALVGPEVASKAKRVLLLPNVELRTSMIVATPGGNDRRVNFHVIFSEETDPRVIEEHFLRELKFTAEANPSSPDERWSLTLSNLESLGKNLKAHHEKFAGLSDLYVGMMSAVVSHEEVTSALDRQVSRFKDRFMVVVPADEDLSKCSWDGQGHLARKLYIQKAHMLFSGNPGTREFGLGRKHESIEDFVSEFKSLKPCIHGSDAHSYDSLFEPAENRYLWVKADPTFQGLRQLLHEPEDRIFLGPTPPAIERLAARPTRVVESINISKRAGATTPEQWFDCLVPLNAELVAIIGNKGNGKSALADVLGLLGNTPRYRSFSFLREDRFRDPKNNKSRHFEASLTWADGTSEGPLPLDEDPDPEAVEKVRYIPQNYLEEICNEVEHGKGSRFYAELQQVIFSHVPDSERLGFNTLDALLDHRGAEIGESIEILVTEVGELNRQIAAYEERMLPRHRRALELQLAEKRRELQAHVQAKPGEVRTPEDNPASQQLSRQTTSSLDVLNETLRELEAEIANQRESDARLAKKAATADKLIGRLRNLQRQVEGVLAEAEPDFQELGLSGLEIVSFKADHGPIARIIDEIRAARIGIAARLNPEGDGSLAHGRLATLREIEKLRDFLSAPQRAHQEYLQKIRDWESVHAKIQGTPHLVGSISNVEAMLTELDALPQLLRRLSRRRNRKSLEIYREKERLRTYYESYYGAVQAFLDKHPLAATDSFTVTFNVAMAQSGFADEFLRRVNKRKSGSFAGIEDGAAAVKSLLDSTNWRSPLSVLRFTRKLINRLRKYDGRPVEVADQLVQDETSQGLYDFVFSLGYLAPIYRLTWDGKGLEQLSPGERGNLLLIFYLLVDRDDIPLVIDQPEENLDNQTIVKTLVPCMKDAKRRRQIVMVTHNPNLAVVCDAEQVIYAEIRKEQGNKVTYLSGSIEDPVINKKIVDVLEGTRPAFDKRDAKYLA